MDLLQSFKEYVSAHLMPGKSEHLLLAVSGGVDSVVLCDLCHRAGFSFAIAHVNFRLRGADSEADEAFVKKLSDQYGVRFHVVSFDTLAISEAGKTGIQETARKLRYDWLNAVADQNGFQHILTAHHADDNAETLLMNFLKGTGFRGLRGMQPVRSGIGGKIARPLLFAGKMDIIAYADLNKLEWREDASNESSYYTRNLIRNEWLPSVERVIPSVRENLLGNISRFNELADLCEWALQFQLKKLIVKKGDECHVPVKKLLMSPSPAAILFEIIRSFGFSAAQLKDVMGLLQAASGKYISTADYRIFRNRNWLVVSPNRSELVSFHVVDSGEDEVVLPVGTFTIRKQQMPLQIEQDKRIAMLDADTIEFPLIIRKWKTGDYFYPLGMTKKKKLGRFFIDNKLSLSEKENVWVVESNKRIVWVAGYRIDERCKITASTKSAYMIMLTPAQQTGS